MAKRMSEAARLSVGLILLLSGCATIIAGTNQSVTIDSSPPGAQIKFGPHTGVTPATFQVPRGKDYVVEVSQGSEKRMVALQRSIEPLTLLNLIPPLWPGFIVDAVTGAITKYEPTTVTVNFSRETQLTQFGE